MLPIDKPVALLLPAHLLLMLALSSTLQGDEFPTPERGEVL